MSPTTILALIISVIILLKMFIVFVIRPKWMMSMVKSMARYNKYTSGILFVIAAFVGYIVLGEINIIQLFVAAFFGMALFGLFVLPFDKTYIALAQEGIKERHKVMIPMGIMILLSIWTLIAIFL